jgi:putative transposase
MLACDFFHVDCAVTLKRIYVFVVLEVTNRSVHRLLVFSLLGIAWCHQHLMKGLIVWTWRRQRTDCKLV